MPPVTDAHRLATVEALRRWFGYPAFRGDQAEIVAHVTAGNSAFVLMPTGGGKSLCYQIPALVRDGLTVVISPLIALMQDQVAALQRRGIAAALLNSTLSRDESQRIERDAQRGALRLLYVAPERLLTERCLALLATSRLTLCAIDEAHCISEWGHDFRPHYLGLSVLAERFPTVPRLALTATADALTQAEIVERLGLQEARRFRASFDRPNIRTVVVPKRDALGQLARFIRREHPTDAGVVYCQSRARVEAVAAALDAAGLPAIPYHAGLPAAERARCQEWFLSRPSVIIVATVAFGMGIDKPDVRFVAHVDVPVSIEGYYQEMGRGGRDGAAAVAWLCYARTDGEATRHRIVAGTTDPVRRRARLAKLDAMLALCETAGCRRQVLLAYFDERRRPCGQCDTCVSPPRAVDGQRYLAMIAGHLGAPRPVDAEALVRALSADEQAVASRSPWPWRRSPRDTVERWRFVLRQAIALGAVRVDHSTEGALSLTAKGRAMVAGARPFPLVAQLLAGPRPARPTVERPPVLDPSAIARLRVLARWRAETAAQHGLPLPVVFHDAALLAIAARAPRSAFALRWLPGVGPQRAQRYGDAVVRLLATIPDAGPVSARPRRGSSTSSAG
jgi:ATP-dependent DNA helicase RecQ